MAVSEKIKSLVGFLTSGFENRDELYDDIADEFESDEYQTDRNLCSLER